MNFIKPNGWKPPTTSQAVLDAIVPGAAHWSIAAERLVSTHFGRAGPLLFQADIDERHSWSGMRHQPTNT